MVLDCTCTAGHICLAEDPVGSVALQMRAHSPVPKDRLFCCEYLPEAYVMSQRGLFSGMLNLFKIIVLQFQSNTAEIKKP